MDKQNDKQGAIGATQTGEFGDEVVSEAVPKYKPHETGAEQTPAQGRPSFEAGKHYTYSDYCTWDFYDEHGIPIRYELIEGVPVVMDYSDTRHQGVPVVMDSPNYKHQRILLELSRQLANFLLNKPCKLVPAPFDVRLNADDADDTVLQPDILVICDHSKLTDKGCNGAPDMTVEILSPSTAQHDRLVKLRLYEKYGVREYWIVEPDTELLTVYVLKNGQYALKVYNSADLVPVHILEGCIIDMAKVFED